MYIYDKGELRGQKQMKQFISLIPENRRSPEVERLTNLGSFGK
jgi:hypothetical protein